MKYMIVLALLVCSTAFAEDEVLDVHEGVLYGASGITVEGYEGTYEVEFIDGSCPAIYYPCDRLGFTFPTQAGAEAASEALLVLFDDTHMYNDYPELVNGCGEVNCAIITPAYALHDAYGKLAVAAFINYGQRDGGDDDVYAGKQVAAYDLTDEPWAVYARWSPETGNTTPAPAPEEEEEEEEEAEEAEVEEEETELKARAH
jgi:hypothetical protein